MFADIDIEARIIWLRSGAYWDPRIEAAIRWTFRVNACAFRHTRSFLKSLIPKDARPHEFSTILCFKAQLFLPKATSTQLN